MKMFVSLNATCTAFFLLLLNTLAVSALDSPSTVNTTTVHDTRAPAGDSFSTSTFPTVTDADLNIGSESNEPENTFPSVSTIVTTKDDDNTNNNIVTSSKHCSPYSPRSAMCLCPNYQFWSDYLVSMVRQLLPPDSMLGNKSDQDISAFLLQQFAVNAEPKGSILGQLHQKMKWQKNVWIKVPFWHARFGNTLCWLHSDTTFYLNASTEASLFPQVSFKQDQIDRLAANRDRPASVAGDESEPQFPFTQRLESHQLYNITLMCEKGARVVVTKESAVFRYGQWRSVGCMVSTEGVLTVDRSLSFIDVKVNYEDTFWFHNVTRSGIKGSVTPGGDAGQSGHSDVQIHDKFLVNRSLHIADYTSVPANILTPSLVNLNLSGNLISNLSVFQFPRLVPSPNLKYLILSNNTIKDVGVFTDLNVVVLDISRNKISFVNKLSFTRLGHLKILNLSGNRLKRLDPGSFKSLFILHILDLAHNHLQQFDSEVSPLRLNFSPDCKTDLSYNRFSHPPFQADQYNPGQQIVYAAGNPFICDCAISGFTDATKNSSLIARYFDRTEMKCKYPSYLEGRRLDDIVFTDTCPVVSDCPPGCTCTLYRNDGVVTVDCSEVEHFQFPETLPPAHPLRLEFQSAQKTPTSTVFPDSKYWQQVISVNISGRGVMQAPDFLCEALKEAQVLDLTYNQLQHLPSCFQSRPKGLPVLELLLGHNPWSCDCDAVSFSSWLADMKDGAVKKGVRVRDAGEVWCAADTARSVRVVEWDSSHCSPVSYLPWVLSLAVLLGLAAVLGPLLYVHRLQAMVALHAHFHIRPFTRPPPYKEEDYDHEALVVHGASDVGLHWVLNHLLPRTRATHHRLCIPERDFLLGCCLADTYASSIARAKSSLCLLSQAAARDEWWLYAFQLSRAENARQQHKKLLLVFVENVDHAQLPEDVRQFMETNTYLSVDDKSFWEKLFYYLPDPRRVHVLG